MKEIRDEDREGLAKLRRTLCNMKQRCYNPKNHGYVYYGARGITICDRWLGKEGFQNFYEDMGFAPPNTSIDRIDGNKGYSPENCRWASPTIQSRNTRMYKSNTSGHRGISWNKIKKYWHPTIGVGGRNIRLGNFKNLEDAVKARKEAEVKYYGRAF